MKLHFGHKLILGFILFGALMGTLVYKSLHTEFELVSKDYYKDEIAYQKVIDASKNAHQLATSPEIKQHNKRLLLTMPDEFKGENMTGEIYFYCPSDSKKDRRIPMNLTTTGTQELNTETVILPATYTVRLNWNHQDKSFFTESYIVVN